MPGYIRGCMEDFKDLNSTAIYRWRRHDYCGYIDRKTLFVPRGSVALQQGAVHLCSCHTSYCNGANAAGQLPYSPQPVTSVVTLVLLTLYGRLQLLDS